MLSAVSPGGMSVAVGKYFREYYGRTGHSQVTGIVIIAIISWVVATFGIQVFHYYERLVYRDLLKGIDYDH